MIIDSAERIQTLNIGNIEVPAWEYGIKNEKVIFLVHGFRIPFSAYYGDLPVAHLAKKYRVIAFDLPGFGYSAKVKMSSDVFIDKILDELKLEAPIVLFGLSYGGAVSLLHTLKHPKKIKAVIVGGTPHFNGFVRFVMRLSRWPLKLTRRTTSELSRSFASLSRKNLESIKTPVLLLYSSQDKVGKTKMGERLVHDLPNATIVTIDSRTHGWLMHDISESGFLKEIEAFLKKINF